MKSLRKCKICGGNLGLWIEDKFDDRHGYSGKFDILRCENCQFGQTVPQLTQKEISEIYTKYYPRGSFSLVNFNESNIVVPNRKVISDKGLWINSHWQTRKGERVLDIGSGIGTSLLEIKKLGGIPSGIDPDINSAIFAEKFNLNFYLGTYESVVIKHKKFDLVCASQVLEHVSNPIDFLLFCKNLITNSGRIILSFPNVDALYRKLLGRHWLHWHIPYHLNHFNQTSFQKACSIAGVRIKSIQTVTPNAWSGYQIASLINFTARGKRDVFWDGRADPIRKAIAVTAEKLVDLTRINRLVDRHELGESFVAKLKVS